MRPNQQNKNRSRGRNGGRKHVNPLSRNFESNGPDVKVRGNAAHVAERYVQLARDAQSTGDSVMAENYYQHAEHYFRILSAAQSQMQVRPEPNTDGNDDDMDNDDGNDTDQSQDSSENEVQEQAPAAPVAVAQGEGEGSSGDGRDKPRTRRPRRRRPTEGGERNDPASAPQPDVGELPAFLTNGTGTSNAAE